MAGGATRRSSGRRLAAALGATAWLVVGAVAHAAGDARAASAPSGAGPRAHAALGADAVGLVGPVVDEQRAEARAMDAGRVADRTSAPPGWSCTPGLCRPRPAAPVRDAAAFGLVVAGAGWIARRRAAAGS